MKITGVRCGRLRVPLATPFKTTAHVVEAIDDIVVMLDTDDGRVGYGSAPASALITGDTRGAILDAVLGHLGPQLVGGDVADFNRLVARVQTAMEHNTSAKAAIDIALHDLFGQCHGAPLYRMLGGGEPAITTDITISVDYIDKMIADAVAAVDRGFVALKLKVGKDAGLDVERVKAVHAAIAGRALLRLDANEGWTPKQAVRAIHQLEDAGVQLDCVEQPVKAWDVSGMAYVTERVGTPIVADESVAAATDVEPVIVGKPEPIIIQRCLDMLEASAEETAILGDRLDTDILGGQRAGIGTILVLTGISSRDEAKAWDPSPDLVVDNIPDLLERWRAAIGG